MRLLNARASMKAEQQRLKTMQEQASIHRAQLNKELLEQKSGGDDVSGLLFKQEKELAELKEQIVSMEEEKTSIEKKRTNWQQEFEERVAGWISARSNITRTVPVWNLCGISRSAMTDMATASAGSWSVRQIHREFTVLSQI